MRINFSVPRIGAFIKTIIKISQCNLLNLVSAKYTNFSTQIELYTQHCIKHSIKHCYPQISRLMLV